jgi:hypothetical protein
MIITQIVRKKAIIAYPTAFICCCLEESPPFLAFMLFNEFKSGAEEL